VLAASIIRAMMEAVSTCETSYDAKLQKTVIFILAAVRNLKSHIKNGLFL
jgi:hypothetical protein